MGVPVRERPGLAVRAGRIDPRLTRALGWSAAGHVLLVIGALLFALYAPAPMMFEAPPGGPVVNLVSPRGDSAVFKVGPLATPSGRRPQAPKEAVKPPEPPQPEPPKVEPKPEPPAPEPTKVEPKPEPPAPPKVEPKPEALPEPKKVEPKPEPKKPEPKPEPKKPEPKPEPKKPEPKPEPKKPEPKVAPKKPKPEPKVEAKKPEPPAPEAPKAIEAKPEPAAPGAVAPSPGAGAPGAGRTQDAGQSGDPNGGGGGAGNRSPEFYAYFGYMYRTIKEQWVWTGEQDATLAATVRFSILADGNIADVRVTERSRSALYDESAINAVRATGALTPPPPSVRSDFEDVELVFRAGDLMQP